MKKLFLFLTLFFLFFYSCTEKINVKLPNADKKIVIEGNIENGKFPEVIITKTIPLFSSVTSTNVNDFYVLDAQVYVSDGTITDTLHLAIDSVSSLGVVYTGFKIIGAVGRTYFLTVVHDGKTYTSVTNIPAPVAIITLSAVMVVFSSITTL